MTIAISAAALALTALASCIAGGESRTGLGEWCEVTRYAPSTDLNIPYDETTEEDRAYRDREALCALAELRLPGGDE